MSRVCLAVAGARLLVEVLALSLHISLETRHRQRLREPPAAVVAAVMRGLPFAQRQVSS